MAKKLRSHRTKDPRRLRELKPEVPEAVEQIVAKMMARKPEDRYPTAAAVTESLQPHSRRDSASFNFGEVLAQRSEEARQRVTLLRQRH